MNEEPPAPLTRPELEALRTELGAAAFPKIVHVMIANILGAALAYEERVRVLEREITEMEWVDPENERIFFLEQRVRELEAEAENHHEAQVEETGELENTRDRIAVLQEENRLLEEKAAKWDAYVAQNRKAQAKWREAHPDRKPAKKRARA